MAYASYHIYKPFTAMMNTKCAIMCYNGPYYQGSTCTSVALYSTSTVTHTTSTARFPSLTVTDDITMTSETSHPIQEVRAVCF